LCLYDLGSGEFLRRDGALAGEAEEPTVREAVSAGCDLVTFSCDKLLGGPQAGVLCGSREAIEPLRQHPLLRALRPDKLTLLALHATLELYRDGLHDKIPAVSMLRASPTDLRARALRLKELCAASGLQVDVVPTRSAVGGGAMPLCEPESYAVSPCAHGADGPAQAHRMEAALRTVADPPVVARLCDGRLLCDVRTVADSELPVLARALTLARKACTGRDNL
jgi:L-seryl-tRNA(Ser) seleniumtransferase